MADRVVGLNIRVQQNARGGKDPDRSVICSVKGGRSERIKALSSLQDLRRRIYDKAKSEKTHRFWGLFVHVAKGETLAEAYQQAKRNGGAPGLDGRTFADIEAEGLEQFLTALRDELLAGTYQPQPNRVVEIPKGEGKVRKLQIPRVPSYCTSMQVVSELLFFVSTRP
jgi:hypothetical protein